MMRSGLFYPSYAFVAGHGGAGLNLERSNALWRLMRAGEATRLDDVATVFFGAREIGMWTEADALDRLPLTALQLQQAAAREEEGHEAAASVAAAAAAAAAGIDADAAGPSAPTEVDVARELNIKRVRDDEEELREQIRLSGKRVYAPGEKPVLEFHIGDTGAGKSRTVFALYPDAFFWYPSNGGSSTFIDGYKGEPVIILDEFRGEIAFNQAKVLFGFQPCTFQTKGGPTLQVLAKKFVFTSTTEPVLWYDDPLGEWARRIREFGVFVRYSAPPPDAAE
jgi:hypothetical protein